VSGSLPFARRDAFTSWFSNTADLGASRDAKGYFARFFIFIDPGTAFGYPGNFRNDAYTQPGDAANNGPYSGYPRLLPYTPAGPPAGPAQNESASGRSRVLSRTK
jgi:hypothetical protein